MSESDVVLHDDDVYEWVLTMADEFTIGEKPWSSREHILQERHKQDYSKEAVESAISHGLINNDLIEWHGLLAPTEEDNLQAILDYEAAANNPRRLLIQKVNRLRSGSE